MALLKTQSQRDCMFIEIDAYKSMFDSEGVRISSNPEGIACL